jgi:hypothetical protein
MLAGGISLIVAGIADFALTNSGHGDLLDPFRNANYALLTNVEIVGDKRMWG